MVVKPNLSLALCHVYIHFNSSIKVKNTLCILPFGQNSVSLEVELNISLNYGQENNYIIILCIAIGLSYVPEDFIGVMHH
jgi:hypothetical protein